MNAALGTEAPAIAAYNLPDLNCVKDDQIMLQLYQMVEFVPMHIPVPKRGAVSYL
jgi:hypothetical protein